MESNKKLIEKFMAKVHKDPPPGECWYWLGGYDSGGYGRLYANNQHRRAHVWAFLLFIGPIPEGREICHKCNHTWCVNPQHLYAGTKSDNMKDAYKSGKHKNLKATDEQVQEIRKRMANGESAEKLAFDFGLAKGTVYNYMYGEQHRKLPHETPGTNKARPKGDVNENILD